MATLTWRMMTLWPVALTVAVLLLIAIAALYPPQLRGLGTSRRWLLTTLRSMAMLALATSIMRPVLVRIRGDQEQGPVIVLLDRSLSMGVVDRSLVRPDGNQRAIIGQLVTLADGLGKLPEGSRSQAMTVVYKNISTLQSMADDINRMLRELDFARLSGRESRATQARLDIAIARFRDTALSTERSAKAIKVPIVADLWIRLARSTAPKDRQELGQIVAKALEDARDSQDAIDGNLYRDNDQVRQACIDLSRMSRLDQAWLALAGPGQSLMARLDKRTPIAGFAIGDSIVPLPLRSSQSPNRAPISAQATESNLTDGITRTLQQLAGESPQAVVLVSDGRQIGGNPNIPTGLLPSGLPIFTVVAGAPRVRDLAVTNAQLPDVLFPGEMIWPRLTVRTLNMDARKVAGDIVVKLDGQTLYSAPIQLTQTPTQLHTVQLGPLRISRPGLHQLTITLPAQAGEVSTANNQVERWVKVLSQKLRVTMISACPSWDYRYLRSMLERNPWVQFSQVIPGQTALTISRQDILDQDLVILHDVPRDALTVEQWDALSKLVHERGGSVIMVPGINHLAQAHDPYLLPYPRYRAAKPAWRLWPGQNPFFHLLPAPGMEDLDALALDDDQETNRRRWDELPGFYRYLSIPELNPGARPLLVERDSQAPLLTETHVGAGRVFFLGFNESWRWRAKVGDRDQSRFWLQLIRYAIDEPYALVSGALSFDVAPLATEPDQPVRVRARVLGSLTELPMPRQLPLTVLRNGELYATSTLKPSGEISAGRYATTLDRLPEGQYELKVATADENPWLNELTLPLRVQSSPEAELANLSIDQPFLQGLSDASGGKCLNLEQIGALPQLLAEARQLQPRSTELHLWNSGYLFVFVLCCLSAEWALRKQYGLA